MVFLGAVSTTLLGVFLLSNRKMSTPELEGGEGGDSEVRQETAVADAKAVVLQVAAAAAAAAAAATKQAAPDEEDTEEGDEKEEDDEKEANGSAALLEEGGGGGGGGETAQAAEARGEADQGEGDAYLKRARESLHHTLPLGHTTMEGERAAAAPRDDAALRDDAASHDDAAPNDDAASQAASAGDGSGAGSSTHGSAAHHLSERAHQMSVSVHKVAGVASSKMHLRWHRTDEPEAGPEKFFERHFEKVGDVKRGRDGLATYRGIEMI
jgi:hypothetical protein